MGLLSRFQPPIKNATYLFAASSLLALRRDRGLIEKLPSYVSAICVIIGVVWLLLLPLDEYSRRTYISENALLPGQVHTYFAGSEQKIFNAYKHEVSNLTGQSNDMYEQPDVCVFKLIVLQYRSKVGRDFEVIWTQSRNAEIRIYCWRQCPSRRKCVWHYTCS